MTVVILTLMIAPIMIALTCEALASVPNSWREGAIALGLNPLRAILAVTVQGGAAGDRGRGGARDREGLGRGDHDLDGLRQKAFTPNFEHGLLVFLYSPLRTLRLHDRGLPGGDQRAGTGVLAVRLCAVVVARRLRALGGRLPDQAAAAQVPGARMSTLVPFEFDEPRDDADRPRPALLAAELALAGPPGAGGGLVRGDRRCS